MVEFVAAGLGGNGGGGGKGKDAGTTDPSPEPSRPVSGRGGGGGGGGTAKATSSNSVLEDDAASLDEVADKGILGPVLVHSQKQNMRKREIEREQTN